MELNNPTRRDFLKTMLAAGAGSILGARAGFPKDAAETVATRAFGKTGVNVSMLGLGGMFDIAGNQLLLKRAFDWGVRYWDTADCYEGGKSEPGFGKFFTTRPESRKEIFLVTKSDARDPAGMTRLLDRSLDRMRTDYIDLYFIHGVGKIKELDGDTQAWVERAKKEGKIRFFGFSAHSNMEHLLLEAADLGWIDGIMFSYNFRLMQEDGMRKAVDAATKAGIGLTAMKTQGGGPIREYRADQKLAAHFLDRGFTEAQAKLKAVWENPQIASICSQMPSMAILTANVAAALDKTSLAAADHDALQRYAAETCSGYCAGCSGICGAAVNGEAPVHDVMRHLMYFHSYGNRELARQQFAALPAGARERLAGLDYSLAEARCPRSLPIGRLMKEAAGLLA